MRARGFEVITKYKDKGINLPRRATHGSAGYDFESAETIVVPSIHSKIGKYVLDRYEMADGDLDADISVPPAMVKETMKTYGLRPTLIPTGIKAYMGQFEELQLRNRSSNALKKGIVLTNGIGTIDSDYYNNEDNEGHIYFQFLNFLPFDIVINKGDKIGQGVFKSYLLADDDNPIKKERKGGHGSTGK